MGSAWYSAPDTNGLLGTCAALASGGAGGRGGAMAP